MRHVKIVFFIKSKQSCKHIFFSIFNDGLNFEIKFLQLKNTTENSKINFTTCHKTQSRELNRIVYHLLVKTESDIATAAARVERLFHSAFFLYSILQLLMLQYVPPCYVYSYQYIHLPLPPPHFCSLFYVQYC